MIFPGFPTTVALSGISLIITDPAPIVTFLPTLIPCIIIAPAPTPEPFPTVTFPQIVALGETCTKLSIIQSVHHRLHLA